MNTQTLIEAESDFDYDEPGIDEATLHRLQREFPNLWFQLAEHTQADIDLGGWPSIRIYNRRNPRGGSSHAHDSIDMVIGYYNHGETDDLVPRMYDEPQLWMRGHVNYGDSRGRIQMVPYRITSTDELIDKLKELDEEYFKAVDTHE